MKKKIVILIVLATMLTNAIFASMTFTDVKESSWYYQNVQVLVEEGIIDGYGDGVFGPEDTMTADQFIKTMVVALGHKLTNGTEYWAQPYIDKALELNIIEEGDFSSYKSQITRAEMAKMVVKVVESLEGSKTYEYNTTTNDLLLTQIADRHLISDEMMEAFISKSYELGIITGYDTGAFKPDASLKRSEACTVIRRVIDATQRKPFVPKEVAPEVAALTKAFGYAPLTNGGSNGIVYTEDMIQDVEMDFHFQSGVVFYNSTREGIKKTWSIQYNSLAVDKSDNFEMQMYEIAYIMEHVLNCDEATIDAMRAHLVKKTNQYDTIQKKKFYNKDGQSFVVKASGEYMWLVEISGYDIY